jgi:hypothetical protein
VKASVQRLWVNVSLLVVAGVAALVVLLTQTLWTSAEREARSTHLVVGFRTDEVDRIEVLAPGKRVLIERDAPVGQDLGRVEQGAESETPARFRVIEPFQGEAEEAAVDGFLRAVELATTIRRVDDATFDRSAAGLDTPGHLVHLTMGKVEVRLRFGNEAPSPKGAWYVEVAGQGVANKGVYVISQSTAVDLRVTPDAFRVKQLVPYGASGLREVVLRQIALPDVRLHYDDSHAGWRVNYGARQVRVNRLAWERLFAAFSRSELERVVDLDTLSNRPSSAVEVEFVPKNGEHPATKIVFGGQCPGSPELDLATRIAPDKVAGCTRALHLDTFVGQPESLVDEGLLSFRTDEIEEVVVSRGEQVLELARKDAAWVMRRPQEGTVEREVGQAFIQTLASLGGELSAPPERFETDVKVVVRTGGDTQASVREQVFELTVPNAEGVFVHRMDDDVWLKVAPGVAQRLLPFDLLLRKSALNSFEAKELKNIVLATPAWLQRVSISEQGKGCTLEAPAGYEIEPSLCLDVIDALRTLRAQSWVAASRDGQFGFESPTARVEWTLQDNNPRVLVVGGKAKGGAYYAILDESGPVFTLGDTFVRAFTTLLVSRAAFALDPELLQSVNVQTRERKVALTRLGDDFVVKNITSNERAFDALQVRALVDALSLLKPEAAVELVGALTPARAPRPSGGLSKAQLGLATPVLEVMAVQSGANGEAVTTHFKVGIGDVYRDVSVFYAEPITDEPHALFVLPRASVARVLEALQ